MSARVFRPGPLGHLLRRIRRLHIGDLRDVAHAQVAILQAHWLMWHRPPGNLLAPAGSRAAPPAQSSMASRGSSPSSEVARLLRAVNRASTYGLTRPRCLTRSIALVRLLHASGSTEATVRIGVRWDGARFVAHAWVEHQGAVLDLEPSLSQPFAPLATMEVAPPGRPG